MLDLNLSLSKAFCDAFLARLDRLLAILDYHFPLPGPPTERMLRPEPPIDHRLTQVTDQSLYEQEFAQKRFHGRTGRLPAYEEIMKEVADLKEDGVL